MITEENKRIKPVLVTIEGLKGRWLRFEAADDHGNYWCLPAKGQNHDGSWNPSYDFGWRAFHGDRIKEAKPLKPKRAYKRKKKE